MKLTHHLLLNKKFLFFLFIGSLLIRSLFFLYFTCHGTNAWAMFDSNQYQAIACNIAENKGISLDAGYPQYYRLPGYPVFLAGCYKLFGQSSTAALWVQLVLASLIPLLVFVLCSILLNSLWLSRIAAIISCVHPGFILYAGMLLTESLAALLLLLFFIFFFHRRVMWHLFAAGMFLGLASLVRPVGHYVLVLALVTLFAWRPQASLHKASALTLGWLLPVALWLIRNFLLTGAFFFHSLPGLHFCQFLAAPIIVQRDHCPYQQARAAVLGEWEQKIKSQEQIQGCRLNDYERCCLGEALAKAYVKRYPGYAVKHAVVEMVKTCVGLYSTMILVADGVPWPDYEGATAWTKIKRFLIPAVRRPLLVPFIYFEIVLHVFLLLGLCLFLLGAIGDVFMRNFFLKIAPFGMLFIGLTLAYGCARLRMPVEPFLIIVAIVGWSWMFKRLHNKNVS